MDVLPRNAGLHRSLKAIPIGALSLALLSGGALPANAQAATEPTVPSGTAASHMTSGVLDKLKAGTSLAGASTAQAATPGSQEELFAYTTSPDGKTATITGYTGTAADVEIPSELDGAAVTAIGTGAFQNNAQLTSVTLPKGVLSIGDYAFANCPKLASVTLNEGLTYLGAGAFQNDGSLTEITLPSTLAGCGMVWSGSSGVGPLGSCSALAQVILADGAVAVPSYLLAGCTNQQIDLVLPDSTTSIATSALDGPQTVTIVANPGTFAQTYAEANGLPYVDPNVHATSVSLNTDAMRAKVGTTSTLAAAIAPSDVTDPITWSSSDPSVASVSDSGVVTAHKAGTATITVSVSGLSASCETTVWQPVTSIALNRSSFAVEAAEVRQLTASCSPADATDKRVTWSSSDPSVATVDSQTGLVTGVAEGSAIITATAADGAGAKRTCLVTVTSDSYSVAEVTKLQSPHPYANSCDDAWTYTLPGADVISVTFDARTEAENTFDYIEVYNGSGALLGTYTGSELAGATLTVGGDTVKVKLDTDAMTTGWGFAVTNVCAVNPDGWVVIDGITYYYVDGVPYKGEILLSDGWHYFNPNTGAMITGLVRLPDGRVVYYDARGVMLTGNVLLPDGWHYFDPNTGNMVTGLFRRPDNTVVYYNPNGAMRVGDIYIDGILYQFDVNTGVLVNEQTVINQIIENTTINNNENNTTIIVDGTTADDDPEPDPVPEVPEGPTDDGQDDDSKPNEQPDQPNDEQKDEQNGSDSDQSQEETPDPDENQDEQQGDGQQGKPADSPDDAGQATQPDNGQQGTDGADGADAGTTEPEGNVPQPETPVEPEGSTDGEEGTDNWQLVQDADGNVATAYLSFTLPIEWRSNVVVQTGEIAGVPALTISPSEQPDFDLVKFTIEDGSTPLIDGDIASYRAASWVNEAGQRITMWCKNPAVIAWTAYTYGLENPFSTQQAVEQAIYLGSGGRSDFATVMASPTETDAITLGIYGQLAIEPTVTVNLQVGDPLAGAAAIEPGVQWGDDTLAAYGLLPQAAEAADTEPPLTNADQDPAESQANDAPDAQPEQPADIERPAEPEQAAETEQPAEPEPSAEPERPEEAAQPIEPEQPAETEPPVEPEQAAETEQPAETEAPAEAVSLALDYANAEDYRAVNELLNVFAQAYPGVAYDRNIDSALNEEAAQLQTEQLVQFGINHTLLTEGPQAAEQFASDADPLGRGAFTAALPATAVFEPVATYCGVTIDPLGNLGERFYCDGEALYFEMPASPHTDNGIMAATSITQIGEAMYEVAFSEYGGNFDQTAPVLLETLDSTLYGLSPDELQAQLGIQAPTARQGKAVIEVVGTSDGTGRQLQLVSFELADPTPQIEPEQNAEAAAEQAPDETVLEEAIAESEPEA